MKRIGLVSRKRVLTVQQVITLSIINVAKGIYSNHKIYWRRQKRWNGVCLQQSRRDGTHSLRLWPHNIWVRCHGNPSIILLSLADLTSWRKIKVRYSDDYNGTTVGSRTTTMDGPGTMKWAQILDPRTHFEWCICCVL